MLENTDLSFAENFEQTLKPLSTGDIVKGFVVGVSQTEVRVDLGGKSDGIISFSEYTDDPSAKLEDLVKVGSEIDVFVIHVNDGEGIITLSKKKIDAIKGQVEINEAYKNKEICTGRVAEIVNGGVVVICKGVRVFIPASQASERYIEDAALGALLNTEVSFKIIDMTEFRGRKKIVGSIKVAAREIRTIRANKFWSEAVVGKKYMGTVKSLTAFGAFVDIGGIDGLVHISELSWSRIKHPSEVVSVGDTVEVYIKDLDKDKNKISLGFKRVEDNPWNKAINELKIGDTVSGKVVRIVPFGAFVELFPQVDGLVHISNISHQRISKPSDELSVGQEINAKILDINTEIQQISLSIKALSEAVVEAKDDALDYTEESKFTIGDVLDVIDEK